MAETSDSILREIEEDLREERIASLWKRYGTVVLGGAVALVVGVAAFQFWNAHVQDQRLETGLQYDAAQELARGGDAQAALDAVEALAKSAPDGYALLARLRAAQLMADAGRAAEARTAYRAVAGDSSVDALYRDMAALRAAMLGMELGVDAATLQGELTALAGDTNPWRFLARELTGLIALEAGDSATAKATFDALVADSLTPNGVRGRAQAVAATLSDAGA